jgi:hypothetical protein
MSKGSESFGTKPGQSAQSGIPFRPPDLYQTWRKTDFNADSKAAVAQTPEIRVAQQTQSPAISLQAVIA